MKANVNLNNWYVDQNVYATGFIIHDNSIYRGKGLCEKILEFKNNLNHINSGEFAAVIIENGTILLIVDSIRSIPLFYRITGDTVDISDDCYAIKKISEPSLNLLAAKTFLHSGFVHSKETLARSIYQVEAGTIVNISKGSASVTDYSTFGMVDLKSKTTDELFDVLSQVFDDYIKILDGRQAVVSLSGGYDSRLILAMLHMKKYDNIACYSYGRSTLHEMHTANLIAQRLGYQLVQISYDEILDGAFIYSDDFREYYRYASNDVSMFYLQDYFAVSHIKQNNLIDSDAVIIAGHTGDVISGGHLRSFMKADSQSQSLFIKSIIDIHYDSFSSNTGLQQIIAESLDSYDTPHLWLKYEHWERKNRQSKFVVNSKRVYDFYGYESLVPLWDKRIIDFFQDLPFKQKYRSKLYRDTLKELVFEPLRINTSNETHPTTGQLLKQRFKDHLKTKLPKSIVSRLVNYSDPYCYAETIEHMRLTGFEFVIPKQKNIWNAYLVQWYLHKEYNLSSLDIDKIINE